MAANAKSKTPQELHQRKGEPFRDYINRLAEAGVSLPYNRMANPRKRHKNPQK